MARQRAMPSLNVFSSSHLLRVMDISLIYATMAGPPKAVRPSLRKEEKRVTKEGLLFKQSIYILTTRTAVSVWPITLSVTLPISSLSIPVLPWLPTNKENTSTNNKNILFILLPIFYYRLASCIIQ